MPLNKIPWFLFLEISRESWRHICWFWEMLSWFLRSSFCRSNLSISCSFSSSNFEIRSEKSMKLLSVSKFVNGLESGSLSFGASFSFSNSDSKFLRYIQYYFIRNAFLRNSIEKTSTQILKDKKQIESQDAILKISALRNCDIPYAHHYNPRLVFFLSHFLLRFIIKSG